MIWIDIEAKSGSKNPPNINDIGSNIGLAGFTSCTACKERSIDETPAEI